MNHATFIGRVGQDAELRYTNGGKAVSSFSMAIDNGKDANGEKRTPTWIKATLWEKRAESLTKYITKGKLVAVSGPVSVEAWVGKTDGNAQGKIVLTIREFEFCGGPRDDASDGDSPREPQAQAPQPISDEDIPF